MRATTCAFGVFCAALMIQVTCRRGPPTANRPPAGPAADPDCVPPKDFPDEMRGVPVSRWIEQLSSPHPARRSAAAQSLWEYGCAAAPATPALTRALKDPSQDVRYYAARTLGAIGPRASSAAPEVINLLGKKPDGQWYDRRFLAPGAPAWTPRKEGGRWTIAKALAALGPEAVRQVLAHDTPRTNDSPSDTWEILIRAFATEWTGVVPGLVAGLKEKNPLVRRWAAIMLGHMDTSAPSATTRLFEQMVKALIRSLLEDPEPEVREWSANALDTLRKQYDHETPLGRLLSEGKKPMPMAVRALVRALSDPNAKVRYAVVVALGNYYSADKAVVLPALERARNDPDRGVSRTVRFTLHGIREFEERERKRLEEFPPR